MCIWSRREILKLFAVLIPVNFVEYCKGSTIFDEERVCIHVYDIKGCIPDILLKQYDKKPARKKQNTYFGTGLPELLLCTSGTSFLSLYQYFWPISQKEFQKIKDSITIKFERTIVNGSQDVADLEKIIEQQKMVMSPVNLTTVAIITLNDYSIYWIAPIIDACRKGNKVELVVIKDPTKSPYLCDYPTQQKGFKRPPP
ncbi:MAG: hypothetical protein A2Y62_08515 [Candidatus Fischerbacteria bacterium RBG_13_37_8]|uniref:Uncharacterized protein n=1 Tax=Candidatus Fischerbacteria bacterium RBG_13_37_8 TaxID=1817863 RepID=A0A1F5VXE1_9BACT|nr:MAG: hypothetical protein A2Y62_08515 [Candidatus Fischerbacteria bacterium RBG_13_37_8]